MATTKKPEPATGSNLDRYVSEDNPLLLTESDITIILDSIKEAPEMEKLKFMRICERTGLDPITRQIYGRVQSEKVKTRQSEPEQWTKKVVVITSIDGFRAIAERTGEYRGQTIPEWYCLDFETNALKWCDVFVPKKDSKGNPLQLPEAARVGVIREGFSQPCYGVANFESFADYKKGSAESGGGWYLGTFWKKMPEHMIAKVAEAQAFRKAFPLLLTGVYIDEEIIDEEDAAAREQAKAAHTAHEKGDPDITMVEPVKPPSPPPVAPDKAKATKAAKPTPPPAEPPVTKAPPATETEDQSPFGKVPASPAEKARPGFMDHIIKGITHPEFLGKRIGDLPLQKLQTIKERWADKFADAINSDPVKCADRDAILAAIASQSE